MHQSIANVPGDAKACGMCLGQARAAAGLDQKQVAVRLRMPVHVIEALEDGRWGDRGADVFVRGQLRSYGRLLDIDIEPFLATGAAAPGHARLVSHEHTPRYQRWMESAGRRAVYVVITAAIAVPVWLATRNHFSELPPATASLDAVPPTAASAAGASLSSDAAVEGAQAGAGESVAAPYVASLAPPVARVASAPADALVLEFSAESWMQVIGADGTVVEQGLMQAGDRRALDTGKIGRVVLGNASAVRVQQGAGIVDLAPYLRANVARFAVSSDGSVIAAD